MTFAIDTELTRENYQRSIYDIDPIDGAIYQCNDLERVIRVYTPAETTDD